MRPTFTIGLIAVSFAARGQVLSSGTIGAVGGGNALSPPAARHLVRTRSGTYLLALQRDTATHEPGLVLLRSDDDGRNWSPMDTLDGDPADRQTADMLAVGDDVALVRSFDGPSIAPDPDLDPGRQVWFQWWRSDGEGGWNPDPPVLVFDPPAGSAFHRAELAIDSAGRIWVQAFLRGQPSCDPAVDAKCAQCVETANGDNYASEVVVAVSSDGGLTFSPPQSLGQTLCRAGGRLISLGQRLLLLWNDYSANENGTRMATQMVTRADVDDLSAWSAPAAAFPDDPPDGIYHGAAMSAVADGNGGLHLVYKDQNAQRLWYRHFDGEAFGPRIAVDDSANDWALQPATTLADGELFIFDNHVTPQGYATRMWQLDRGLGPAAATTLESESWFYGYPSAPETLSAGALAFLHSRTQDPDSAGCEVALRVAAGPFDATLSADPPAIASDGTAGSASATIVPQTAFAGIVALSVSGAPPGSSVEPGQPTLAVEGASASARVELDPGTAPNGDYELSVNADFDSRRISAPLDWRISRAAPTGRLVSNGGPVVLPAGRTVALQVAVDPLAWFDGRVSLGAAGLPAGVSAAPSSIAPGGDGVLTLGADEGAADGVADCSVKLGAAPMQGAIPFQLEVVAAPAAQVLSPAGGAVVSGSVRVDVSTRVSAETSLARLELWVDGALVASVDASPWQASWDSTTVADGPHLLSALVEDAAGGTALSNGVPVSVQNRPPTAEPDAGLADAGVGDGGSEAFAGAATDGGRQAPLLAAGPGCSSGGVEPLAAAAALAFSWRRRRGCFRPTR